MATISMTISEGSINASLEDTYIISVYFCSNIFCNVVIPNTIGGFPYDQLIVGLLNAIFETQVTSNFF